VQTEVLRGMLAPFGHGLWTGILGGILFSASSRYHFAITARLALAYVGVSLLHGLWDSMHSIALTLTLLLTHHVAVVPTPQGYLVEPTPEQLRLFTILEWTGLAVVSIIGISWLAGLARRSTREPLREPASWRVPIR